MSKENINFSTYHGLSDESHILDSEFDRMLLSIGLHVDCIYPSEPISSLQMLIIPVDSLGSLCKIKSQQPLAPMMAKKVPKSPTI